MTASTKRRSNASPGCVNCVMRGLGLCRVLIDSGWDEPLSEGPEIFQESKTVAARRTVLRPNEITNSVLIICEGWAASILYLADGQRQILSFLLPGELVAAELLFEQKLNCSIETITPGRYRTFDRLQLKAAMFASPKIFDRMLTACSNEKTSANSLIADLGRRTATERVARLLLGIWDRLQKAGLAEGDSVDFPLRQSHIADATGLTLVYVNKILAEFRKAGLATITDRSLHMTDMTRLRRLAP